MRQHSVGNSDDASECAVCSLAFGHLVKFFLPAFLLFSSSPALYFHPCVWL